MNFLYTQQRNLNKFESDKVKFHKSLYAETGKLEGSNMSGYKTGPLVIPCKRPKLQFDTTFKLLYP